MSINILFTNEYRINSILISKDFKTRNIRKESINDTNIIIITKTLLSLCGILMYLYILYYSYKLIEGIR